MPNRIISDISWKSKKVRQIKPLEFRPEYAWLIPLANDCGVFEFDAESIWQDAYAGVRPDWTPEKVQQLMDEFVRVGLWETFEQAGHTYAWLVGSQKPGLLPKPSERSAKSLRPPDALLARHSSGTSAPHGREGATGYGNGDGFGSGSGMGKGSGSGDGHGTGTTQVTDPVQTQDTHGMPDPEPAQEQVRAKAAHQETNDSSTITNPKPVKRPYPGDRAGLVSFFYRLVKNNPRATATPANWEQNWTPDIEELLKRYKFDDVVRIMETSQNSKYAQYVYRGATLLKYASEIATLLKIEPKKTEIDINGV
jgi:hypothetical protein